MISYIITAHKRGFTLIETLVAVSLMVIAIVAPMSLVAQSLATAYYARDQVAAYSLAQEAIEAVRAVRDGNILSNATAGTSKDLLDTIPIGQNFTVDARVTTGGLQPCGGTCDLLKVDPLGELYGHDATWTTFTKFRRTVYAQYAGPASINLDPISGKGKDEIRVTVTVTWETASGRTRMFKMYSNMYRWIEDGAAN
ncbi:MAG: prepilin-type N-terminal cleavage/methylation domain-containing protein [Candidatus Pacebacteria bacterium]|nr:prepilin-type N-terminal cleavage/methylation domain-containing protein [Candidatus Paceibacterota bacterium]